MIHILLNIHGLAHAKYHAIVSHPTVIFLNISKAINNLLSLHHCGHHSKFEWRHHKSSMLSISIYFNFVFVSAMYFQNAQNLSKQLHNGKLQRDDLLTFSGWSRKFKTKNTCTHRKRCVFASRPWKRLSQTGNLPKIGHCYAWSALYLSHTIERWRSTDSMFAISSIYSCSTCTCGHNRRIRAKIVFAEQKIQKTQKMLQRENVTASICIDRHCGAKQKYFHTLWVKNGRWFFANTKNVVVKQLGRANMKTENMYGATVRSMCCCCCFIGWKSGSTVGHAIQNVEDRWSDERAKREQNWNGLRMLRISLNFL